MPVSRIFPTLLILAALAGPVLAMPSVVPPALAANRPHDACLNKSEQRAAVASHQAIPLELAIKSLRERAKRNEVVRAELCQRDSGLVYVLTLLARNGKVTRATVDAVSGEPINGH